MVLDIINWILGMAEVAVYYFFISNLTEIKLVEHRIYFLICSVVLGALVAYNRLVSYTLASWPMILFQISLIWLTLVLVNRTYVVEKLSLVLFVNICNSLLQLLLMLGAIIVFQELWVPAILESHGSVGNGNLCYSSFANFSGGKTDREKAYKWKG